MTCPIETNLRVIPQLIELFDHPEAPEAARALRAKLDSAKTIKQAIKRANRITNVFLEAWANDMLADYRSERWVKPRPIPETSGDAPQLPIGLMDTQAKVMSRARVEGCAVIVASGEEVGQLVSKGKDPKPLCPTADLAIIERMHVATPLLSSRLAHSVFPWLVMKGHEQMISGEYDLPHIIRIPGSWASFAERLGEKPGGKVKNTLKLILEAMAHMELKLDRWRHYGLLSFSEAKPSPNRKSELVIELGAVLMPGAHELFGRGDNLLVPLTHAPPIYQQQQRRFVGDQRALQLGCMIHFRRHAKAYAKTGVIMESEDWHGIAKDLGLSLGHEHIDRIVEHWHQDADDAPALLVADGRYKQLKTPHHQQAHGALLLSAKHTKRRRKKR